MSAAVQSLAALFSAGADAREGESSWLRKQREEAMERFVALGLPTTRLEAWKHTKLRKFSPRTLVAPSGDASGWSAEQLAVFGDLGGPRLVFVDGAYRAELSTAGDTAIVRPLSGASADDALIADHLGKAFGDEENAFASANTALFTDGVLVTIPRGKVVEEPIEVVFATSVGGRDEARFTRNLIVVGKGAQATLVERHVGRESSDFGVSSTEIFLHDGAVFKHLRVQEEATESVHIVQTRLKLGRDANYRGLLANLGGELVRSETRAIFEGENGTMELDGFYVPRGREHVDTWTVADHASAHCFSRQLFKGVLSDKSRGVFNGLVIVRKDAQKTDAIQRNPNILLSDRATVDTRPQLEIYADDVKCTHGATIGRLDDDALFYLRARGIALDAAREMLTTAFAGEVVDTIEIASVKEHVAQALAKKLQGA